MKRKTSTLVALAAVAGLFTAGAAQAHPGNSAPAGHAHKSLAPAAAVQVITQLPGVSTRVVYGGRTYFLADGHYYLRVGKGWRRVAAPAAWHGHKRSHNPTHHRKRVVVHNRHR